MSSTRWRLHITAVGSGASCSIAEVEMASAAGGADLCTGGTATADSNYSSGGYEAVYAFDNNAATRWNNAATSLPAWLEYQFSGPVTIAEYRIQAPNVVAGTITPIAWTLQSWNGSSWDVIDTRTGQTGWTDGLVRTYTLTAPSDPPIAHWLFDEATGTTAADVSGNGHTATLSHGTWDTVLKVQGAAALANTVGGVGATFASMNLGTTHTLAYWINGWNGSNAGILLGGPSTATGYAGAYIDSDELAYACNGPQVVFTHGGLTGVHHLAFVRSGTSVTAYRDGVSLGTLTLASNPAFLLQAHAGYADGTYPFVGTLDDVRVYDVALTAAQIQALVDLYASSSVAWVSQVAVEVLAETEPIAGRLSQAAVEVLVGGPPVHARLSQIAVEVLLEPTSDLPALVSQVVVEVLVLTTSGLGIGPWLGDGGGGSIWIE